MLCVLITGVLSLLGCAGPNKTASTAPMQMVCADTVTKAEVVQAAEYVLTRMQFPIEKLDAQQGIVRTRPLRGAQFFEFWRSDNVGAYDGAEASLQSIHRSVELRVTREAVDRRLEGDPKRDESRLGTEAGGTDSLQPTASRLCLLCTVAVQRLRLPGNEVTGVSAAYGIYARSTPTLQGIEVDRQPRRDTAWIDLGQDQALAARILSRVAKRLEHAD